MPVSGGGAELVRYQLSQVIPFPGKRGARGEAATARARSAEADAVTVARSIRVIATQTFYQALHNQRALELNEDLRRLVEEASASGRARYQTGAPNHHEWLLAKAELGVLATERTRLESSRRALRAILNELRDRPADGPIDGIADLPAAHAPAGSQAPPSSPELESLDAVIGAARAEERAARLGYVPDFVVQGMAEQPRDGMEDPMWGMMLGMSLPVFWGVKQAELAAAVAEERAAAIAERQSLENRLHAEEIEAREQLATAEAAAELYRSSVLPLTALALESARSGYAYGRVSLAELVSVARTHRLQQLEYLAARIDVELAHTRVTERLSSPPVLRLAPVTPTLFGAGMGGVAMSPGMPAPSAIRVGRGIGLGAARGAAGGSSGSGGGGAAMGGM